MLVAIKVEPRGHASLCMCGRPIYARPTAPTSTSGGRPSRLGGRPIPSRGQPTRLYVGVHHADRWSSNSRPFWATNPAHNGQPRASTLGGQISPHTSSTPVHDGHPFRLPPSSTMDVHTYPLWAAIRQLWSAMFIPMDVHIASRLGAATSLWWASTSRLGGRPKLSPTMEAHRRCCGRLRFAAGGCPSRCAVSVHVPRPLWANTQQPPPQTLPPRNGARSRFVGVHYAPMPYGCPRIGTATKNPHPKG